MAKNENKNNLVLFDVVKKEVPYHNDFANAIFTNFSRKEKQLLLTLIAGIKEDDSDNNVYHFNPKQIKEILNMKEQRYSILANLIYSIQKKPIGMLISDKKIKTISIFDEVTYNVNDESISVSFGKSAIQLFKKLKGNFSKYFLENIVKLEKENSIEFYLRAESSLFKGNFYLEIEDFSKIFNVNYKSATDIKKHLINICIKDIKKNTDIDIECNSIKKGRSTIGFSFEVKRQLEYTDELKNKIEKIKRNIYISRSGFFKKDNLDKTIHTLLRKFSIEKLINGLDLCYDYVKKDFNSLSYLENAIDYALKKDSNIKSKKNKIVKEKTEKNKKDNIILEPDTEKKEYNLELFNQLSFDEKAKIEKKALSLLEKDNVGNLDFVIRMKNSSPNMYQNTIKKYIIQAMEEEIEEIEFVKDNNAVTKEENINFEINSISKKRGRRKKLDMLNELDKFEEVTKNEKKIISFVKKIYGKDKVDELKKLKNDEKIEIFWNYYIELLKFNEKNKK